MKRSIVFVVEKVIKILQLQLFLSLLSFPLIALWGLPISTLSVLGNLLFTPCVILFVAISTIIFFTELVHIPNDIFIFFLEYVTEGWYYCLSWGKKSWVVGIPNDMIPCVCILALCALLVICHKRWGQLIESTCILGLLYGIFFAVWYCITPISGISSLTKGKSELCFVCNNGRNVLYDADYLRRIQSCESWVEYTLIPLLIRKTGTIVIDIVWLDSFSPKVIPVLINLMEYAQVHTIKIPYFVETLSSEQWREFFSMYEKAKQEGTCIERSATRIPYICKEEAMFKRKNEYIFLIKKQNNVSFS